MCSGNSCGLTLRKVTVKYQNPGMMRITVSEIYFEKEGGKDRPSNKQACHIQFLHTPAETQEARKLEIQGINLQNQEIMSKYTQPSYQASGRL